ncbi:hypothetical protein OUZ56_028332 [Daphnia magna]|uniref:Uncharacterized protein n=1 Tax=Daphnia magna TaxID=35525 RepID=A0ABR0B3Q4_9CRUS|nr:hypothetical protein OUZ56_028332 [Daphnia magna]
MGKGRGERKPVIVCDGHYYVTGFTFRDSESDDGDDAASSDAPSRSPSPADLERSSYSPDVSSMEPSRPNLSVHHPMTTTSQSSRILNHPSGSRGSSGGVAGRSTAITEPSAGQQHQTAYANGSRHATPSTASSTCGSATITSSSSPSSSSATTNHHHHANSNSGGKNNAAAPALVSCPVNLTPSQFASLAANLPALSGLSLPHLPRGTNFASLLASDVGAALQQQSNCAKDAIIKSTTSLMVSDQKSDNLAGSTSNNSSHSALNLRTATTTSTANRDKKGGGTKSRAAKKTKK